MLHETMRPVWNDGCEHGECCYVGTAILSLRPGDAVDIYVFETPRGEQEVCVRYGNEYPEYRAPGSVENVLRSADHEPYSSVARVLLEKGSIRWQPNTK